MTDKELQELKNHAEWLEPHLEDMAPDELYGELKWFVHKLTDTEE